MSDKPGSRIASSTIILILIFVGAFAMFMAGRDSAPDSVACNPPSTRVSYADSADVADLFRRLVPLARDSRNKWYSSGVVVTFYPMEVRITFNAENGETAEVRGATLAQAAGRLSGNPEITKALEGYAPKE